MAGLDEVLGAVSRIHAAGLDAAQWPGALQAITTLMGGKGGSLEVMQRPSFAHAEMHAFDLAAVDAYVEYYAPVCRRIPFAARQAAGSPLYEGLFVDETSILADPFYMEFLADYDMRYFVGGVVANTAQELVLVGVQRSPAQGHPDADEIALFGRLLPHIQQAFDVMRRLRVTDQASAPLDGALEWLKDGVLLLAADGRVMHANAAARAIGEADDGVAFKGGLVELASARTQRAFGLALHAALRLHDEAVDAKAPVDLIAGRPSGKPPYVVSVRPILGDRDADGPRALVFIHDPLADMVADTADDIALLQEGFDLTPAEAHFAVALRAGSSPGAYARERGISLHTAYTHLRRVKDKCGHSRMAELVRALNEVRSGLLAP